MFNGNPNDGGTVVSSHGGTSPGGFATVETTDGTNYFVVVDSWPSPSCYDFTLSMSELVVSAGCTDAAAFNYDAEANTDDGSCSYDAVSCAEDSTGSYDYTDNEDTTWTFTADEGENLSILLSGSTESGYDYLMLMAKNLQVT